VLASSFQSAATVLCTRARAPPPSPPLIPYLPLHPTTRPSQSQAHHLPSFTCRARTTISVSSSSGSTGHPPGTAHHAQRNMAPKSPAAKSPAKAAPAASPSKHLHPSYITMVAEALAHLHERGGSSIGVRARRAATREPGLLWALVGLPLQPHASAAAAAASSAAAAAAAAACLAEGAPCKCAHRNACAHVPCLHPSTHPAQLLPRVVH